MKKATQKFLCILLAVFFVSAMVPIATFAENQQGEVSFDEQIAIQEQMLDISEKLTTPSFNISEDSVIEIGTADDLIQYRDDINSGNLSNAILVADIDLSGYCSESWIPIGTVESPYSASFNGNGYRISNLYISTDNTEVQALFGYVAQGGTISNLTVSGSVIAQNAAGISGQNDGIILNCCNEAVIYGQNVAAGLVVINNGTVSGSSNNGYIKTETGVAGGISGSAGEVSEITNCINTANIHGVSLVGGITGSAKGIISDCKNVGEIYSTTSYVGGIVGKTESTVLNCLNTGVVQGTQYVGGICGRISSDISNAKNYGEIYASASYAGGITGYVSGGSSDKKIVLDKCVNYGKMYVNDLSAGIVGAAVAYIKIENAYNYGNIIAESDNIGGIIGYTSDWAYKGSYELNKTANFGTVKSSGRGIAGIAGRMLVGKITNSYNAAIISGSSSYGGVIGIGGESITINNSFDYSSTNKGFSYCTVNNVYILSTSNSGQKRTSTAFRDGTVLSLLNDETVWKQGEKYPIFVNDITEEGIKTEEQLKAALNDASVTEVSLAGDISISEPISINRNFIIKGNNHTISGKNGVFIIYGVTVAFSDILLKGDKTLITATNSEVEILGNVVLYNYLSTGIKLSNSVIKIDNGATFTAMSEQIAVASDTSQNIQNASKVTEKDGRYLYYVGNSNTKYSRISGIVLKAENNEDISYDVRSVNKDSEIYLMIPSSASLQKITYTEIDANGKEYNTYTKDFTDGGVSVQAGYNKYNVQAMQSGLPTLYIEVDEAYGTIDAMHSDPEHDTKAYGQIQVDVPDALVEEYGWDKTYKSKEGDSDKPGTMEIKGRGNSTWNTTPGVKKPYQVKSEKKVDFLGMGKAKTWCLLKSGEKQKYGLDLGLAIGLDCTPDSRFVDVFMNGEYYGYYAMTEKVEIKEERVEITDLEEEVDENGITADTDLTGGYLLELDNYAEDLRISTNGNYLTIKSPENLDKKATKVNNYSYIYNHIDDLFNAIYGNGTMKDGSSYLDHIDIESFVRYYWHQEFIANFDCGIGSTYMYKDSDKIDHKVYAGPIWDSDNMFKVTEGWYVKNRLRNEGANTIYNQLLKRKDFTSYVIWYYENGIKDILEDAVNIAVENSEMVKTAKSMDALKWSSQEYGGGNTLINNLNTRYEWINEHYIELMNEATIGDPIDVEAVLNTKTPYIINSVILKNSQGVELDSVPLNSTVSVNVNLTNIIERVTADKVIVACYDVGGKMIATNNIDVKNSSKTPLWTSVPISIGNQAVKRIKVFVWKDLTNITPLCNIKEIVY